MQVPVWCEASCQRCPTEAGACSPASSACRCARQVCPAWWCNMPCAMCHRAAMYVMHCCPTAAPSGRQRHNSALACRAEAGDGLAPTLRPPTGVKSASSLALRDRRREPPPEEERGVRLKASPPRRPSTLAASAMPRACATGVAAGWTRPALTATEHALCYCFAGALIVGDTACQGVHGFSRRRTTLRAGRRRQRLLHSDANARSIQVQASCRPVNSATARHSKETTLIQACICHFALSRQAHT